MSPKRPDERGKRNPEIPPDQIPQSEDELLESEAERNAREDKARDQAATRLPKG
jgi:hypothetical protein